ncbi:MCE family protein [Nocardioides sp. AE5]|uniref:MCE family protein n=1 Tax=Nocardioides sp. AE5 TaxID=2962573 RepID=UPI002882B960|nr:MCE family protein [Nocardioides sp. AE5]MDT0201413.1 MCE family protein [Nocardioides sp. AE5]
MATMTARPLVRLLAAAFATMMLTLGLSSCSLVGGDTIELTVELEDSSGLFLGNDVGVLGVSVGKVTAIEPVGDRVRITLQVDADVKIPADAGAVVVSRSMATDRYVELTPVYNGGPTMQDGDTIEPGKTRTPVEWDEVLAAIDTLSEGLNGVGEDGEKLRELLDATAETFDGNGQVVRDTIANLVAGTSAFADNSDEFETTLKNLDTLTAAIAKNDALTREFISNITKTTELVRDERTNLEASVESLAETIRLLGIFTTNHRDDMSRTVTNIEDVSARIMKYDTSLDEFLRVMPVAMENLGRAINDNQRLDVKMPPTMLLPGSDLLLDLCESLNGLCDALGTAPDLGAILDAILGLGGRP